MSKRLDEIRARLEAATPGPWTVVQDDINSGESKTVATVRSHIGWAHDAAFIAHAPDDIRWLLENMARITVEAEMVGVCEGCGGDESRYANDPNESFDFKIPCPKCDGRGVRVKP